MAYSAHSYNIFTDKETFKYRDPLAATGEAIIPFLGPWLQVRRKYLKVVNTLLV